MDWRRPWKRQPDRQDENTKHQAPNTKEISSSKSQFCPRRRRLGACGLKLFSCLELGVGDLVFRPVAPGAFPSSACQEKRQRTAAVQDAVAPCHRSRRIHGPMRAPSERRLSMNQPPTSATPSPSQEQNEATKAPPLMTDLLNVRSKFPSRVHGPSARKKWRGGWP